MKKYLAIIMILLCACSKQPIEHTLFLNIKTPFRYGTITINESGSVLGTLAVLADSTRYYTFYSIPENTNFTVTINRDLIDTGVGNAMLEWNFANKIKKDQLYFDTLTFKATQSYTAE